MYDPLYVRRIEVRNVPYKHLFIIISAIILTPTTVHVCIII